MPRDGSTFEVGAGGDVALPDPILGVSVDKVGIHDGLGHGIAVALPLLGWPVKDPLDVSDSECEVHAAALHLGSSHGTISAYSYPLR